MHGRNTQTMIYFYTVSSLWSGSCRYLYWLECTVRGRSARPCKWEFLRRRRLRQCVDSEYHRHQFTVSSTRLDLQYPNRWNCTVRRHRLITTAPWNQLIPAESPVVKRSPPAGHPRWVIPPDYVDPCSLRHANPRQSMQSWRVDSTKRRRLLAVRVIYLWSTCFGRVFAVRWRVCRTTEWRGIRVHGSPRDFS